MIVLPFTSAAEHEAAASRAARHLHSGGLMACPTETVYGFGCLVRPDALERLARLKSRLPDKAFLLLVTDERMIPGLRWTAAARRLVHEFWPGPLTLVLRCEAGTLPTRVLGANGTVAIRATSHPGIQRLLRELGEPITSTSANAPGGTPARTAAELAAVLEMPGGSDGILVLDGGSLPPSPSSTIVDCSVDPPVLLRRGAIGWTELLEIEHGLRTLESAGRTR
jgi:L-threonylcarbamoyladenylate synthase